MLDFVKDHWNQIVENWNIIASIVSFFIGGTFGYCFHILVNKDKSSVKNKVRSVKGNFVGRDNYSSDAFKSSSKK